MKNLLRAALLLTAVFVMSGCTGTKKYTRIIKRHYDRTDTTTHTSDINFTIVAANPSPSDTLVGVRKGKSYFIPALLYWGAKETFYCDLNTSIPTRIINNTFCQFANESGLKDKLKGRRLAITIESLPSRFDYYYTTDAYVIIIYAFIITNQSITPEEKRLVLSWKLYEGQEVVKEGQVSASSYVRKVANNLQSMRKITWSYLAQYDQTISEMSTECLMQLVNAL